MTTFIGGMIIGLFSYISLAGQTEIGIYTGLNASNVHLDGLSGTLVPDTKNIYSGLIGARVNIPLDSKLKLVTGAEYTRKGFDVSAGTNFNLFDIDIPLGVRVETRINTLEVPLHISYNFGNENYEGYVLAGPNVTRATTGTIRTFATTILDFGLTTTDIDFSGDRFNQTTLGGTLGVGGTAKYGNGKFFGEVAYKRDFTDFLTERTINTRLRHQGYNLKLGYLMSF